MEKKIKVLIADDHPSLRLGLKLLLEKSNEISVVGEVHHGQDVINAIEELEPDVVLLDCQLPGINGIEVANTIIMKKIKSKVLVLSSYDDDNYIRGMIKAKSYGYLLKDEAPEVIVEAVKNVNKGKKCFSQKILQKLTNYIEDDEPDATELTEREKEVLTLLSDGLDNKQIADQLYISQRTVKFHLSNIYSKLNINSRTKAILYALEHGIITKQKKA